MLAGKCDEIVVSDLIRARHQICPHNAVGATEVGGDKLVARISDELSENSKCQFGRQAVS